MSNHIVIAFNLLMNALWNYALYVMQKYKNQFEMQMGCVKSMNSEAVVRDWEDAYKKLRIFGFRLNPKFHLAHSLTPFMFVVHLSKTAPP